MTAVDRIWPPPDGRERIEGRWEGGWIATGRCGGRHLVAGSWRRPDGRPWFCTVCARVESRNRITAADAAMLAVFYPPPPARGWWQP